MATTWSIIDGNLPFLQDFPAQYAIEYSSDALWQMNDGELPYRNAFPQLNTINDAPSTVWTIKEGMLPDKAAFPKLIKFTDVPYNIWAIKDGSLPYRRNFPPMPDKPRMWGSTYKLTLKEMHQNPLILKTQKSTPVNIGEYTIQPATINRIIDNIDWELI